MRGRVPPRGRLPRRLPGPAERQPRLLGRPRRERRLGAARGRQPSADRAGARRLPRRRRDQALRRAGVVPGDRARRPPGRGPPDLRRTDAQRRRDGHASSRSSSTPATGRSSATASTGRRDPAPARSRTWPSPTRTRPSRPSTTERWRARSHDRDGGHQPRARRHPERRAPRAPVALRRHLPAAAHRRPRRGPRARPAAARPRRCGTTVDRSGPRRVDHRGASRTTGLEGARGAAGLARQLRARVPAGHGRPRRASWATSGRAARSTGRSRSASPDVHVALAALSPDAARLQAVVEKARRAHAGARRRRADLAAGLLPAADRADVLRLQGRDRPAGGRGQRQAALQPAGAPAQGRARSSSATPTRRASCRRCRRRTCSAATAPTSSSASCTRGWRPTGSTCARRARAARKRRCSAPRWSGAGRAAPRSRSRPSATTRSSAPTRSATTTSSTATTRAASSAPLGAHARRANPRDAFDGDGAVDVRLHRMIRRGTSYGPMLPEGVLEDDGADRGIIFVFAGAHLGRQFEFVKTQWLNDGIFIGAPLEKDPLVGPNDGTGTLHRARAADPPPAAGPAAVRRHPRRRVLLRPGPARDALAGGARAVTGPDRQEEDSVATNPTGTDRWKALDFGPPPSGARGARLARCSSTTSPTAGSR